MGGLGFSKSKSQSSSEQQSFIDPAQQGFLNFLRQGAQGLQQQQQGRIGELQGLSEQLGGLGQGFIQGLEGFQQQLLGGFGQQGFGQGQAGIDALTQQAQGLDPASQALAQQAFGENPNLQAAIGQLGGDITRQFERGIGATNAQAVGAGQLGGGRQGVAQGLLGESAQRQFAQGSTQLRSDDIGRRLQAAQSLGGLQQGAAGQLSGFGLQQNLGQQGINQAGVLGAGQLGLGGLSSLGGLFDLGFQGFQSQFAPLQNLAGIIGGPTVLSSGSSQGSGSSFSANASVG